jgi:predicted MFS family arabinose efflux permease
MRAADARFLTSGAVFLAVAMGVGRFAYTPILPVMERDAGLSVSMAGALATANLFGYLIGASIAMHPITHGKRLTITRLSLAGVVITTALMAGASTLWLPLRFLTGICSGLILVFATSIVLERSAHARQPAWPPLFFSGVGFGIAFSGVAVPALVAHGGSNVAWVGIALASAIALAGVGAWFTDLAPPASTAEAGISAGLRRPNASFGWLLAIYTAEGFAYIIPATFLVAIIEKVPGLSAYAGLSWVVVGLAGAFAMFPWISAGALWGKGRCLAIALAIQALGVAAPAFSQSAAATVFSAIAFGGTFMAITLFAAGIARDMFPAQSNAAVSRLTVLYSIGQMCGPVLATQLELRFKSYDPALIAAAGVICVATAITMLVEFTPKAPARSAGVSSSTSV